MDIQTEEILEKLRAYKADIYGIETTSEVKDVDELLVTQLEWYSGTPQNCLIVWAIFVCRMMASRAKSLFLSHVE